MATASDTAEGLILLNDLRPLVPFHPAHIRKLARRGEFPKPMKICGRTVFRRADVLQWIDDQTARASEARP